MKLIPYPEYKDSGVPWLRKIPIHWGMEKLKYIATVKLSNVDKNTFENEIPVRLCNYMDVYHHDYIVNNDSLMKATATHDEIENFTLHPGDVLITKDSEDWKDIAVPAYVPYKIPDVLCGYHLAIVRSYQKKMIGEYLFHSFYAENIAYQFRISANGVTRYGLSQIPIKNSMFPAPPKEEQEKIVKFLRSVKTTISQFIRGKRRLIELLKEQKQAIINRAVTRGIDPNVRLKPSGVDWLGDIPEHWLVMKFKHIAKFLSGGTPEKSQIKYWQGDIPWVSPKDMKSHVIYDSQDHITAEAIKESATIILPKNNFLIVVRSGILRHSIPVAVNSKQVTFNQDIKGVILNKNLLYPYYLLYLIFGCQHQLLNEWRKNGATVESIEYELMASSILPLPPLSEQESIRRFIQKKGSEIDTSIFRAEREIELIREYRTRLIADVVTGKVDVRDVPVAEIPDIPDIEETEELDASNEPADFAETGEVPDEDD